MKRKTKTKPRRKKPAPKTAPTINVTINVVAKARPSNSKQALLMYDRYLAERQGLKFSVCEMK